MEITAFKKLGEKEKLGRLYCKNGQNIQVSEYYEIPWSLDLNFIYPIIFFPEGNEIGIVDIKLFGSMIYPKKKTAIRGFWWWKHAVTETKIARDIDIAVITKKYSSTFIEKAELIQTYDMGLWLHNPGIDLVHIPEERIDEDNSISRSIKKGVSLFSDNTRWRWKKGLINCYV